MHGWLAIGGIAAAMFLTLLVVAWIEGPAIEGSSSEDDQ